METHYLTPKAKVEFYKMKLRFCMNTIKKYYLQIDDPVFPPTEEEKNEAEERMVIIIRHLSQLKEFTF